MDSITDQARLGFAKTEVWQILAERVTRILEGGGILGLCLKWSRGRCSFRSCGLCHAQVELDELLTTYKYVKGIAPLMQPLGRTSCSHALFFARVLL